MYYKLPRKLVVCEIQRHTLTLWPNFLLRAVRTLIDFYSLERYLVHFVEFIWGSSSKYITKHSWVQCSLVRQFLSCIVQDLYNLGGFCLPSWMGPWRNNYQTPHGIEARHDQWQGWLPELTNLHKIVIEQDIYLHVREVPTWRIKLRFLIMLHPMPKLDIPMYGGFWE